MFVGYMRVSTADDRQSVDLQRDALVAAGVGGTSVSSGLVGRIHVDVFSFWAGVIPPMPMSGRSLL